LFFRRRRRNPLFSVTGGGCYPATWQMRLGFSFCLVKSGPISVGCRKWLDCLSDCGRHCRMLMEWNEPRCSTTVQAPPIPINNHPPYSPSCRSVETSIKMPPGLLKSGREKEKEEGWKNEIGTRRDSRHAC
jgi:hypothetical protein